MISRFCEKCRKTRTFLTAVLIMMSALAGYHWCTINETGGMVDRMDYLIIGITLVLLVVVVWFGIDTISSRVEAETVLEAEKNQLLKEEAETSDKNVREMSKLVESLMAENARLRAQLAGGSIP